MLTNFRFQPYRKIHLYPIAKLTNRSVEFAIFTNQFMRSSVKSLSLNPALGSSADKDERSAGASGKPLSVVQGESEDTDIRGSRTFRVHGRAEVGG